MIKVSIIVPVYNVELYLEECILSLLHQTLKDIEIILVNDASPDHSDYIMETYRQQYPDKIKCIYLTENLKQGGARNVGLDAAKGEYITFVDSDDYIDSTLCQKLYDLAARYESDMVYCDYYRFDDIKRNRRYMSLIFEQQTGELSTILRKTLLFSHPLPFAKLIRREMLLEHRLVFPERMRYEDLSTVPLYAMYAKRIDKVSEPLYYYRARPDSTVAAVNAEHQLQEAEAALLLYRRMQERGFIMDYQDEIKMLFIITFYLRPLISCFVKFTAPPIPYMSYLKEKIREIYPDYSDNPLYYYHEDAKAYEFAKWNDISPELLVSKYNQNEIDVHYDSFYEKTKDKAILLLDYCKNQELRIALWGAGKKGRDFLKTNDPDPSYHRIHCVIDANDKLHGSRLETEHSIVGLQQAQEIDVILIINQYYYYEIANEIRKTNKKLKIFNLDAYLNYDLDMRCWFDLGQFQQEREIYECSGVS